MLRRGALGEAWAEFTAMGRLRLRRYRASAQRRIQSVRGQAVPAAPERIAAGPVPRAALDHEPVRSGIPLVLYAASDTSRDRTEHPWRELEPQLDVVALEGRHRGGRSIMSAPRVSTIGDDVTARLRVRRQRA